MTNPSTNIENVKQAILDTFKDTDVINKCIIAVGGKMNYSTKAIICAGMNAKYINIDKMVDDLAGLIIEHYLHSML